MKNTKETNIFLAKYYLQGMFDAMFFVSSFIMIIVNENIPNAFNITVLLATYSIVKIIFEIPSGAFADRFGRKNTVILGEILRAVAFVFLILRRDFTDFFLFYLLFGFRSTLRSGALGALMYDNMKKLGITKNFAKYSARKSALRQVCFALSAFLSSYLILYGYNVVIIATMFTSIFFSTLIVLTIKDTHWHDKNIQKLNKDYLKILKKGFIYSFKHVTILKFILLNVIAWVFLNTVNNFEELIFLHITNNLQMVPLLIATSCIFTAVGQFVLTKYIQKKRTLVSVMIIVFSLTLILMAFLSYSFPITFGLLLFFWLGFFLCLQVLQAKKQMLIPSKLRATINSVEGFLIGIVSVIYLLSFGYIVEISSYKIGLVILSGFTLAVSALFIFVLGFDKHLRKKEARK
jgi:MFS family permease